MLTQADRHIRVHTPLGEDVFVIESFEGSEGISTPFQFRLSVLTAQASVDPASLLKKPVVVSIRQADDSDRHFHGLVNLVEHVAVREDGLTSFNLEIVSWVWFLSLFEDCRIFQNMDVLTIVRKVFSDRGFTDFEDRTTGSYPTYEYCVQYREPDLNFVSRLLEREGIFYFFEHTTEKHTLVMADGVPAFADCPGQAQIAYDTTAGGWQNEDVMLSVSLTQRSRVGKYTVKDYDFTKPNTTLEANLDAEQRGGEFFEYPAKYNTVGEGSRISRVRMEEQEVLLSTIRGSTNCRSFRSGFKFTLSGHPYAAGNIAYTLLQVNHKAAQNFYRSREGDKQGEFDYRNDFQAIPNATPYRPPRLAPKPVVQGSQTAVVSGKSGEEIWVDQYGRVKVQFFWDREGKSDEKSSCWVRVAQLWAGKGWGAVFIPRIGQEVIVDFLEGDPDQPIITGRVYNADQTVPYALPGEQTKSTIKSMSSKGAGGFNEIRLEDKKGSEQIFINAEKDIDLRAKNDRKETIERDRHLNVTRDKMEQVGRDIHIHGARDQIVNLDRDHHFNIAGKEAIKITGSHSMEVDGDVIEQFKGNHSSQVTSALYLKGMNIVIEAATELTLKVGGNFIDINSGGVYITGTMVYINSGGAAGSGSPGSLVSPLSPTAPTDADQANPGDLTAPQPAPGETPASTQVLSIQPLTSKSPAADVPTHNPNSSDNRKKTHWIEIKLADEDGKPIPGEAYRVTLPDGTVADGTLDDKGTARVEGLDPGNCQITFPNLDKDAWEQS